MAGRPPVDRGEKCLTGIDAIILPTNSWATCECLFESCVGTRARCDGEVVLALTRDRFGGLMVSGEDRGLTFLFFMGPRPCSEGVGAMLVYDEEQELSEFSYAQVLKLGSKNGEAMLIRNGLWALPSPVRHDMTP